MRIVVTGAGGFVGRGLIAALGAAHDVIGIDSAPLPPACHAIQGDLCDPDVLAAAFGGGCDAVVHLATVPGGAAEVDPALAKGVNLDASMALIEAAAAAGGAPRFLFASSIAVFGEPLPTVVDDQTPLSPRLLYGAHKAMIETWVAAQSRRGAIDGLSLRFPGVVARPAAAAGLKSAFMSDVFHALRDGKSFVAPVAPSATLWLMSRARIVDNIRHALTISGGGSAVTLPALRITMGDLVATIAQATGSDVALVRYDPDPVLQAAFGNQPPLATRAADALGFTHDGNMAALVARALAQQKDFA